MVFPVKLCNCGTRLKGGTQTYQIGICTNCINTLPEYASLRKEMRSQRFKKYYALHREEEKRRGRLNYKIKKMRREETS